MQQMVLYCKTYRSLNMFRAPFFPSSGAQEFYTGGCCLWYLVLWFTGCWSGVELQVGCPVCGMLL
jgi:ABC-type polysaccharide/polyol phosphate export permease